MSYLCICHIFMYCFILQLFFFNYLCINLFIIMQLQLLIFYVCMILFYISIYCHLVLFCIFFWLLKLNRVLLVWCLNFNRFAHKSYEKCIINHSISIINNQKSITLTILVFKKIFCLAIHYKIIYNIIHFYQVLGFCFYFLLKLL